MHIKCINNCIVVYYTYNKYLITIHNAFFIFRLKKQRQLQKPAKKQRREITVNGEEQNKYLNFICLLAVFFIK